KHESLPPDSHIKSTKEHLPAPSSLQCPIPISAPPSLDALATPLFVFRLREPIADQRFRLSRSECPHPTPCVQAYVCCLHDVYWHVRVEDRSQGPVQLWHEARNLCGRACDEHILVAEQSDISQRLHAAT